MKYEKIYIDLSKCSEKERKHIFSLLPKDEITAQIYYMIRNSDREVLKAFSHLFYNENSVWQLCSNRSTETYGKTELTYHEFIKIFEGGDGENETYSFSYLSCGKTLTVHIEAKNFNKAMIEFATNYHDIEWLYHAKIL